MVVAVGSKGIKTVGKSSFSKKSTGKSFDLSKVGPIRDIDYKLSRMIYDLFNEDDSL